MSILLTPYGGTLIDLLEPADSAATLAQHASTLPSITLSERASCDLELLATGAFSPLDRFMNQSDFERVVTEMRLADGTLFPIPVTLGVEERPELGDIALRGSDNALLAVMTIEEIYEWDLEHVATNVFGTNDRRHPLVAEMESGDASTSAAACAC
jgi:sulfate adenylyltransferase